MQKDILIGADAFFNIIYAKFKRGEITQEQFKECCNRYRHTENKKNIVRLYE